MEAADNRHLYATKPSRFTNTPQQPAIMKGVNSLQAAEFGIFLENQRLKSQMFKPKSAGHPCRATTNNAN